MVDGRFIIFLPVTQSMATELKRVFLEMEFIDIEERKSHQMLKRRYTGSTEGPRPGNVLLLFLNVIGSI